ncbi:2-phospho-L-lactate guanylyltransferase [Gordonia sp. TBRC 11910]|uniref:Phosphoenolpyruvate guanylyltransferase n=1 Tax=Gordonia asplenii TaxID=2725283 RepID=A0A848KSC9_9ACTN|nr:2-phospho-L-lactate guanylyltransferase [Gordonia asplenii]NMO01340.1 2-phospho-L-lactate guanylyltransferase [Gordonia asplenii]
MDSPPILGATRGEVAVVLAVKELANAKSRLAPSIPDRAGLVLAMFADTVDAVRAAGVEHIVVVSPDTDIADWAGRHGVTHVDDPRRDSSLNAAFAIGADAARSADRDLVAIALLQADIPAVRPAEFDDALTAALAHPRAVVADREGTGTTMLVRHTDIDEPTAFGRGSAAAHRAAGAVDLDPLGDNWPGLRTDVDTLADLRAAAALGMGKHTSQWIEARPSALARERDAS